MPEGASEAAHDFPNFLEFLLKKVRNPNTRERRMVSLMKIIFGNSKERNKIESEKREKEKRGRENGKKPLGRKLSDRISVWDCLLDVGKKVISQLPSPLPRLPTPSRPASLYQFRLSSS